MTASITTRFHIAAALGLSLLAPLGAIPANAEVEKFMNLSNGQMQPVFRLKFNPPKGWAEDKTATKQQGLPMYVPAGKTFANAPAVLYIRVTYNREGKQSLENFIEIAHTRWKKAVSDSKIEKVASQSRSDGRPDFLIYHFANPASRSRLSN